MQVSCIVYGEILGRNADKHYVFYSGMVFDAAPFFWVQSPKALSRSSGRAIMEPWRSLSHPTENYMGVGFKESALKNVFLGS